MKKKLYYQFSDGDQYSNVIMQLDVCMSIIEDDMRDCDEEDTRSYFIIPIWLTDEEYEALPEAEF